MVLGGILPIDQLTNYAPAMALLAEQIPKATLEARYGINLPNNYNFEDILSAYAYIRGFMTARGLPDSSRASRIILKDYVDGRLNYCHAPPSVPQEKFQPGRRVETVEEGDGGDPTRYVKKPTMRKANQEKILDSQFFSPTTTGAHVKGKTYIASGITGSSTNAGAGEKPWRQINKRNKKEKLRIVYRHLDIE
jgi:large subunit GTPase 1